MPSRARRAALFLVAVAAVVVSAPRRADTCIITYPRLVVPGAAPAAIDSRIWLFNHFYRLAGNPSFERSGADFDADFVLREVGGGEIAVGVREWCPGVVVEITPRAKLAPGKRFEVWLAPKASKPTPVRLTTFITGTEEDHGAPGKPRVVGARYDKATGVCGSFDAIQLIGAGATDPQGGEVLYAMWQAGPDGTIRYDREPIAILPPWPTSSGPLRIERETCRPDFGTWAASHPKLGVRAMDASGNLGEPVELKVE